tara:strand:+ start:22453 stop:24042 length:1590 start_codon:yes stop_codon:yes gene_type:complete
MESSTNFTDSQEASWERFCDLLWYGEEVGCWLDISRMNFSLKQLSDLQPKIQLALEAMDSLEAGGVANPDERRQVGHYWLRNPEIAPNQNITDSIQEEIKLIDDFGKKIIKGEIKNNEKKSFTDVLWIGIGGSGLGPLLLVKALKEVNNGLKFHFIDNCDPEGINCVLDGIGDKLNTTLFVTVSKSGGTPEPKIGMEQVRFHAEYSSINWPSQSVAITMSGSKLYNQAKEEAWLRIFDLPDWVGGRTSITGAVGLLTCSLIDVDIKSFLNGAKSMDILTRNKECKNNPAALLSLAWWFSGDGKGKRDMVLLPYKDKLEVFSRYLQQLVMESLGKKRDRKGDIVNQGISVYGNKGSTDQHAYVQQLRDGLDNFFVTFIEVLDDNYPSNQKLPSPGNHLSGFLQGTRSALTEAGKQSITITIKSLNEFSLGALIALYERSVGIYAELVNVNAYHQPGVEAGKKAAQEILELQIYVKEHLEKFGQIDLSNIDSNKFQKESFFFVIRHLVMNFKGYTVQGNWNNPSTLIIKKT